MKFLLILSAAGLLLLSSCATPQPYVITDVIPAGSRIEYYAQVDNGTWKKTLKMNSLPRPMPVAVAEKWALSAAQQRLGGLWKDYRFRVILPEGPVVVWQRRNPINY